MEPGQPYMPVVAFPTIRLLLSLRAYTESTLMWMEVVCYTW